MGVSLPPARQPSTLAAIPAHSSLPGSTHQICDLQLGDALDRSSFSPLLSRSPIISCLLLVGILVSHPLRDTRPHVFDRTVDLARALQPRRFCSRRTLLSCLTLPSSTSSSLPVLPFFSTSSPACCRCLPLFSSSSTCFLRAPLIGLAYSFN